MNVLVVEDEKRLAATLEQILTDSGYHVDVVYDGQSAVDYAVTDMYDMVILDVMLPRKDGFEAVREIRQANISTRVIFLTDKCQVAD